MRIYNVTQKKILNLKNLKSRLDIFIHKQECHNLFRKILVLIWLYLLMQVLLLFASIGIQPIEIQLKSMNEFVYLVLI